jgi:hypothetical protein
MVFRRTSICKCYLEFVLLAPYQPEKMVFRRQYICKCHLEFVLPFVRFNPVSLNLSFRPEEGHKNS